MYAHTTLPAKRTFCNVVPTCPPHEEHMHGDGPLLVAPHPGSDPSLSRHPAKARASRPPASSGTLRLLSTFQAQRTVIRGVCVPLQRCIGSSSSSSVQQQRSMFRLPLFACVCALVATTPTAISDDSEAAQGATTVADINRSLDILSSKLERLTVSHSFETQHRV